jgi:hypothetical protein
MSSFWVSNTLLRNYLCLPDDILNKTTHLFVFNYICAYLALTDQHRGNSVLIDDQLSTCFTRGAKLVKVGTKTLSSMLRDQMQPSGYRPIGAAELRWFHHGVSQDVKHLDVEVVSKLCIQVFEQKARAILRDEWTSLGLKKLPIPWGKLTSKNLWQFPLPVRKNIVTFLMLWKRLKGYHDLKLLIASYIATK